MNRELDVYAWYVPETCTYKVRILKMTPQGKRGIIIHLSEEYLARVGEAQEIPIYGLPSRDVKRYDPDNPTDDPPSRWTQIARDE